MKPRLLLLIAALACLSLPVGGRRAIAAAPIVAPASDRIGVTIIGGGADVVLIPGLAASAEVWEATATHLAAGHRVHIVQVAGFAGTPAGANATGPVLEPVVAALHAYIAANRLEGAAVIGHSLGGLIALRLALAHPGDAGRLMIVDALPFYGMLYGAEATVAMTEPLAASMRDRLRDGSQQAFAAAEPMAMAPLIKSRGAAQEAALAAAIASDHRVVAQALYDDLTTDVRPGLATIAVPVTVLYPWDAAMGTPQAKIDRLYTSAYAPLQQARVERIDGSFHFIMIDQPQPFLAAVDRFLAP